MMCASVSICASTVVFKLRRGSIVSAFLLVLVLLSFCLSSNAFAQTPKRLQIVAVSRKLNQENVLRFVRSVQALAENVKLKPVSLQEMATRDLSERVDFERIDVVLWMNSAGDVDDKDRDENRGTIDFLKRFIEKGKFHSRLKFHVINRTDPGDDKRNSGQERAVANAFASTLLFEDEKPTTIRLQADMETTLPVDLSSELFEMFDDRSGKARVEWGLLGLDMFKESEFPHEDARYFSRVQTFYAYCDLFFLVWGQAPLSGISRIVSRVSAFESVGGYDSLSVGEDRGLISQFKMNFLKEFSFHPEIRIQVPYSPLPDGSDGPRRLSPEDQNNQHEILGMEIQDEMHRFRNLMMGFYLAYNPEQEHWAASQNSSNPDWNSWREVKAYIDAFARLQKDRKNNQMSLDHDRDEVVKKLTLAWLQDEVHLSYLYWYFIESLKIIFKKQNIKFSPHWVYNWEFLHAASRVSSLHEELGVEILKLTQGLDALRQVGRDYGLTTLAKSMSSIRASRILMFARDQRGDSLRLNFRTKHRAQAWKQLAFWLNQVQMSERIESPLLRPELVSWVFNPAEVSSAFDQNAKGSVVIPAMALKVDNEHFAFMPSMIFSFIEFQEVLSDLRKLSESGAQLSLEELFLGSTDPCTRFLRRIGEEGAKSSPP